MNLTELAVIITQLSGLSLANQATLRTLQKLFFDPESKYINLLSIICGIFIAGLASLAGVNFMNGKNSEFANLIASQNCTFFFRIIFYGFIIAGATKAWELSFKTTRTLILRYLDILREKIN